MKSIRPRTLISLVFLVLLLGLAVFSFYGNVLGDGGAQESTAGTTADAATVATGETPTTSAGSSQPSSATSDGMSVEQVVPASLSGLPVTNSLDGEEAKVQTEQLHGKGLGQGFDAAWIAQYGNEGQGTLWVSRSATDSDAQTLMDRMSERIGQGTSPFKNFKETDMQGTSVVTLDGMGQKHYYFRVGTDLYWLAMEPVRGEQALQELLDGANEVGAQ